MVFWSRLICLKLPIIRDLKIRGKRRQRKRCLKSEFAFFQSSSRFFQIIYLIKCRRTLTLLELNSQEPYPSTERERKFRHYLFTSSIKGEIRHFPVLVVQWQQRNVQKSLLHVQTYYKPIPFFEVKFSLPSQSWHLNVPIHLPDNVTEAGISFLFFLAFTGGSDWERQTNRNVTGTSRSW